jgi:hypothetical protein
MSDYQSPPRLQGLDLSSPILGGAGYDEPAQKPVKME